MTTLVKDVIKKSLNDFFSAKFLTLSIAPILIVFSIVFGVYFVTDFDFVSLSIMNSSSSWFGWILSIPGVSWLVNAFLYILIWGLLIVVSVVLSIIVVGFFTPKIVKEVQKRHYPDIKISDEFTLAKSFTHYIKIFFIFFTLLALTMPLAILPGINLAIIYLPFYYLFHNFLVLDVGSSIVNPKEFKEIVKNNKALFRSTTLTLYLISLIPFSGILLQVFYVIVIAHEFFMKREELS
jgi:ABC-type sugar transport system permease subunit